MIMSMNTRAEILQMVADGVITQEEADRLIDALGASGQGQSDPPADGKLAVSYTHLTLPTNREV